MLFDVTAYAAEIRFNPFYSGTFTFATRSSIEVSKYDVVLTKVWNKLESGASNFVSTNDPEYLIFDRSQFLVSYNHRGKIVDLYTGEFKDYTPHNVFVESHDIGVERNFWGIATT